MRADTATQRHLYATTWLTIDAACLNKMAPKTLIVGSADLPACECISPRVGHDELAAKLLDGGWSMIATIVATQKGVGTVLPLFALEIALTLVQTPLGSSPAPSLLLLTAGTEGALRPAQLGLWGLARSTRAEASLPVLCLDSTAPSMLSAAPSVSEPEVVVHGHAQQAPRLTPAPPMHADLVRLNFHSRGAISNLFLEPLSALPSLNEADVLLSVRAVGLNFRDVLNVLGEYPGDPGPPGMDASGSIVQTSDHGVLCGDAAFGFGYAPFACMAKAAKAHVVHKPASLSFEQASTLPVTWSTTHTALQRAGLRAGRTIIAQAAAGGVGLKAVEYAHWLSGRVVGTAGRPHKHALVCAMNVRALCSSRDGAAFVFGTTRLLTGGRSHAVFNSLSLDFIAASFASLGQHGAFEEIGKRGVWSSERHLASVLATTYCAIALDTDKAVNPRWIHGVLGLLAARTGSGSVHSLPFDSFDMEVQHELAFRTMQNGLNLGKIVVRVAARESSCNGTQVVTGGTGGLGLLTGRWLAQRGVRHLVLASRSGTLAHDMAAEWAAVQESGVDTTFGKCDTAQVRDVRRLIAFAPAPLQGIWHAAGALADAVLGKQNAAGLAFVYAPKAHGGWNLHQATMGTRVDVCALFSSVIALLGGAGQANYGAANACLDAVAVCRHSRGTAASSVQWGAWAEVGMAARGAAGARMAAMAAASGFGQIALAQGLMALGTATRSTCSPVLSLAPIVWSRFLSNSTAVPAFLTEFAPSSKRAGVALGQGPTSAAVNVSLSSVLEMVKRTAGGAVDADAPLMEAGVDSLGAVELRNQLQSAAGSSVSLPSTLVFDHPTARQLVATLQPKHGAAAATSSLQNKSAARSSVAAVDGMSPLFPGGAPSLSAATGIVAGGCAVITEVPAVRWDVQSQPALPEPIASRVRHLGFVWGAELADNTSFGVSPSEAAAMDPCQRLVLERGYAALHDASMHRASLGGSLTGVFLGFAGTEFSQLLAASPAGGSVYAATGSSVSIASGRLSYALGLHGPCVSYDTACSAALAASHAALRALQFFECSQALVLGTTLHLGPSLGTTFAVAGMTSLRGLSHTFDSRADGYARGEACGSVVLRVREDGAQGLRLRGSAVRQDGRSASLTAPSGQAQAGLIVAALGDAGTSAAAVALIEAHGTGTALGDPIEAGSLVAAVLAERGTEASPIAVGGVKANIGHAEPAAGMTGLLKLSIGLQKAIAAPNAQLRVLNPMANETFQGMSSALAVQAGHLASGPESDGGVSSFGYSGTIAHAVLRASLISKSDRPAARMPSMPRRSFAWLPHPTHDSTTMYSLSWAVSSSGQLTSLSALLVLASGRANLGGDDSSVDTSDSYRTTTFVAKQMALLLSQAVSASPLCQSLSLVANAAQQIAGFSLAPRLLLLTSETFSRLGALSSAGSGSVWGLARVIRLEQPGQNTQSRDVTNSANPSAFMALTAPWSSTEPEITLSGNRRSEARLRFSTAERTQSKSRIHGKFAITGGLGGLGLRAMNLLLQNGASGIILSSRGGRASSGALNSCRGARIQLTSCDVADGMDARLLLTYANVVGVLHAAGILRDTMLRTLSSKEMEAVFAPKAIAAFNVHRATTGAPMEVLGLFSSVASISGNIGQANYAAGNAYLDLLSSSRRNCGVVGSTLQIPAVKDSGMGAKTFDAAQLEAVGAISLDLFAQCLSTVLMNFLAASERTQAPLARALLAGTIQGNAPWLVSELPRVFLESPACAIASQPALAQGREVSLDDVIATVKKTAGVTVDADAPLMEAGVDSLGEIELRNQLQSAAGVTLPSALLAELPTARQLESAIRAAPKVSTAQSNATAMVPASISDPASVKGTQPESLVDNVAPSGDGPGIEMSAVAPLRSRRHRALMLHGRAADGALMERLLTALGWAASPIDFVTVTALHQCDLRPDLYPSTVTFPNGAFDWGMNFEGSARQSPEERPGAVLESVEDIERILSTDAIGFDGIGGICDGSLIASLVAARLPPNSRVCFYINMCGGPWTMIPDALQTEKLITMPSLHLIGKKDDVFTRDELLNIPFSKCTNPTLIFHGAGHAVPLVSDAISDALESLLQRADIVASSKDYSTAIVQGIAVADGEGDSRLMSVAEGAPRPSGGSGDLEYDSLALLNGPPKEPPKKAPLAHLTGLRGFFIMLVVIIHFVPRPYSNKGETVFVDYVDVAKGWMLQDATNKFIDRIPTFGMPYLFVASGFGCHLTYRKKTYKLYDFYMDRLPRMMIMLWLCMFIELIFDKLTPTAFQPFFQPGPQPLYSWFVNAITLGNFRAVVMQVHNVLHAAEDYPNVGYITPTTSETMNKWLSSHANNLPMLLHLWFLSFTILCVLAYPFIAKVVRAVERRSGALGLAGFCLLLTYVAIIPMLVDRGEVMLQFNGSTWQHGMNDLKINDTTKKWYRPFKPSNRTDIIVTDTPWYWTHYVEIGPRSSKLPRKLVLQLNEKTIKPEWVDPSIGDRLFTTKWRDGHKPTYKMPWFQNEPSNFWPLGYIMWFACGVATVAFMVRMEEWARTQKAREDAEAIASDEDVEGGKMYAHQAGRQKRLTRLRLALGKAFVSHEWRGRLADACILSVLVPCMLFKLDYDKITSGYLNRYGWNEFANWNKAYIPVFCLFLYGSASEGGAGRFASFFSTEILVKLGDISLAIYALQATLARICGVRWVMRGPNQDDYCKEMSLYTKSNPGGLLGNAELLAEAGSILEKNRLNCVNATGDQVTVLIIVLLVVAYYVTYDLEPYLDEKFKAAVALASALRKRKFAADGTNSRGVARVLRLLNPLRWGKVRTPGPTESQGEREGLLGT